MRRFDESWWPYAILAAAVLLLLLIAKLAFAAFSLR